MLDVTLFRWCSAQCVRRPGYPSLPVDAVRFGAGWLRFLGGGDGILSQPDGDHRRCAREGAPRAETPARGEEQLASPDRCRGPGPRTAC